MSTHVPIFGDRPSSGGGGTAALEASYLAGVTNEELTTAGTETVVGGFVFDPSVNSTRSVYFRAFWTLANTAGVSPTAAVRLYDRGAPGASTAGTLVAELNAANTNVPETDITAAFTVDPTTPSSGVIVNATRMYEVRAVFTDADSLLVRWAGVEIR